MKEQIFYKPTVFIASPYTQGDPAMNTHFQCKVFDRLLSEGRVIPVAPLWSHFQHLLFPRPYEDWISYDQQLLKLFDCCLRLDAYLPGLDYNVSNSAGADAEVEAFLKLEKPVFYSIEQLYSWLEKGNGR
ncbi:MAG: TIR domain-containing protein [Candidatus Latescibacterota bacterium]